MGAPMIQVLLAALRRATSTQTRLMRSSSEAAPPQAGNMIPTSRKTSYNIVYMRWSRLANTQVQAYLILLNTHIGRNNCV